MEIPVVNLKGGRSKCRLLQFFHMEQSLWVKSSKVFSSSEHFTHTRTEHFWDRVFLLSSLLHVCLFYCLQGPIQRFWNDRDSCTLHDETWFIPEVIFSPYNLYKRLSLIGNYALWFNTAHNWLYCWALQHSFCFCRLARKKYFKIVWQFIFYSEVQPCKFSTH